MVATALNNYRGTRVTHGKALSSQTIDKAAARGSTKEGHIAYDDVLVKLVGGSLVGMHRNNAARETLAKVIVCIAAHVERDAGRQEGTKALACRTIAVDGNGTLRQALGMRTRNLAAQNSTHAAVDVGNVGAEVHRAQMCTGIGCQRHKECGVECTLKRGVGSHLGQEVTPVGTLDVCTKGAGTRLKHSRKIKQVGLPVARNLHLTQALGMTHHLVNRTEAQTRHNLAHLLGHKEHEVLNVLRLALKATTQTAILRGDARRAGVLLAVALHEATHGDERHGSKAKLLGTQQARHGNISAVHKLAVGLEHHAGAQAVLQQRLLCLSQAKLQRQTGMPDGIARSSARAAVMARNQNLVSSALSYTGGNGAYARLGAQLDRNARARVGVLEVKNQLSQVLNGVNIVVRRRRNKANTRRGLTHLSNPGVDLLTRQMTTLARLGALSHLDLNLNCRAQVAACYTKAARSNLLNGGVLGITVGQRRLAAGILAALTGVGTTVQTVHGNGHALVRLATNGAKAHGARVKATYDVARALHLVQSHGRATRSVKVEQIAQANRTARTVHQIAVLAENAIVTLLASLLQQVNGLRLNEVILTRKRTPLGQAKRRQLSRGRALQDGKSVVVARVLLALNVGDAHAAHARNGACKVLLYKGVIKAYGLKNLRGVIALHGRDAHLRHDGNDTCRNSAVVVSNAFLGRNI